MRRELAATAGRRLAEARLLRAAEEEERRAEWSARPFSSASVSRPSQVRYGAFVERTRSTGIETTPATQHAFTTSVSLDGGSAAEDGATERAALAAFEALPAIDLARGKGALHSPAFLTELQKLCDAVPSYPTVDALRLIEAELGRPPAEVATPEVGRSGSGGVAVSGSWPYERSARRVATPHACAARPHPSACAVASCSEIKSASLCSSSHVRDA